MPPPTRYLLSIALFFSLAAPGVAEAQRQNRIPSQPDLNEQAAAEAEVADAELNRVWRSLPPALRDQLRAKQRAWIVSRDARCYDESEPVRGGQAESMVYSGCVLDETKRRTAELRAIARNAARPRL